METVEESPAPAEPKPEPKNYSVGAKIQIGGDDAETLKVIQQKAAQLAETLGDKRVEYLTFEAQVAPALQKQKQDYRTMIETIAAKRGLNIGPGSSEQWNWDPPSMTFTRVG
mgnify:CR=1 FL=1